ncbi:BON domain-containing protein [Acidobacteria bacterium AB60]|nr:BON domain-containing protein [Acidobacteria bacterium AB60]
MRRILLLTLTLILGLSRAQGQNDERIQAAARRALHAYSLAGIQASVRNGIVALTGDVSLCRDRLLAVQMMTRIHGVKSIDDEIEVEGPSIPDEQLQSQIDRIISARIRALGGFGSGSISARLEKGVVTLSGTAAIRLADPAITAIAGISGIRNVVDRVVRVSGYDSGWQSSSPGFASIH